MSVIEVVFAVFGLLMAVSAVLVAVGLMLPSISAGMERARVEREAQVASWQIHQQATRAFGELLDTARRAEDQEEDR